MPSSAQTLGCGENAHLGHPRNHFCKCSPRGGSPGVSGEFGEEGVGEDEGVKGCLPSPALGLRPPEAYWPAPPAFQNQFPSVPWGGHGVESSWPPPLGSWAPAIHLPHLPGKWSLNEAHSATWNPQPKVPPPDGPIPLCSPPPHPPRPAQELQAPGSCPLPLLGYLGRKLKAVERESRAS